MRLLLPRGRLWRSALYLLSFLLVLIAADMVLVQIRRGITPGFDTTRIVSPLMPDGRIDYLAVLDAQAGEGVTPENNSAVLLLQAFGRAALSRTQPTDGITNKLGMAHLPEQGDYLILYYDFAKQHPELPPQGLDSTYSLPPWPMKDGPFVVQWVNANQRPLDLIVEASKRSRFFIPFDGGNRPEVICSVLLPHVNIFRQAGLLLLTRALERLNSGDFDGFRQDLLAVHRLARLLGQSPTAIERVTAREGLENPACQAGRAAAASGKLSVAQLRTLSADLNGLHDLPPLTDAINGERFMILDILQSMAEFPPQESAHLFNGIMGTSAIDPEWIIHFLPIPYEQAMRSLNHFYDGALAAIGQPDYPRRMASLQLWREQLAKDTSYPFLLRMISSEFGAKELMLSVVRMAERDATSRMERQLTQIALALAEFKAEHGNYPAALADLCPAYLPAVPNDSFTDLPLIYAPTSAGYTLFSVGPQRTDGSGKTDEIIASIP